MRSLEQRIKDSIVVALRNARRIKRLRQRNKRVSVTQLSAEEEERYLQARATEIMKQGTAARKGLHEIGAVTIEGIQNIPAKSTQAASYAWQTTQTAVQNLWQRATAKRATASALVVYAAPETVPARRPEERQIISARLETIVAKEFNPTAYAIGELRSQLTSAKDQAAAMKDTEEYNFHHALILQLDRLNPDEPDCADEIAKIRTSFETNTLMTTKDHRSVEITYAAPKSPRFTQEWATEDNTSLRDVFLARLAQIASDENATTVIIALCTRTRGQVEKLDVRKTQEGFSAELNRVMVAFEAEKRQYERHTSRSVVARTAQI